MNLKTSSVPLVVRFRGPGVRDGRILLADLVHFGRQLQTAVDRVACVVSSELPSAHPGRRPERIRAPLEVVALSPGSFAKIRGAACQPELALDFRRDRPFFQGMDLGQMALEKLVRGLPAVAGEEPALPSGYDVGVLVAWRETASLFEHGLEAVDLHLQTPDGAFRAVYDGRVHQRVVARIQGPVRNLRTVEGRLLMADFKEIAPRCRIHPPVGPAVEIEFEESLADAIYDHLRSFVRVTGEAEEDPYSGRVRVLRLRDIEPVAVEAGPEPLSPQEFWREASLEELAAEQGVPLPQNLDALSGAGAQLWETEEDFDQFLADIYARRRNNQQGDEDRR